MSIENRPFIGSWKMGAKKLVQHTPDSLVFINGDLALPGCQKCNSRIDIQKYLTEVSVDASTDAGGASASFSLSIPQHSADSMIRDAQFILRAGLEVHIYMRGYFPVKGLYSNLNNPTDRQTTINTQGNAINKNPLGTGVRYTPEAFLNRGEKIEDLTQKQLENLQKLAANMETLHQYMEGLGKQGLLPGYAGGLKVGNEDAFSSTGHVADSQHHVGNAVDLQVSYTNQQGKTQYVDATTTWAALTKLRGSGYISKGGIGAYLTATQKPGTPPKSTNAADYTPTTSWTDVPHYDTRGSDVNWCWYNIKQPDGSTLKITKGGKVPASFNEKASGLPSPSDLGVLRSTDHNNPTAIMQAETGSNTKPPVDMGTSFLSQNGLAGNDVENVLAYPYYHVFHGVVTQVTHSYSGGANTASVQCVSMLHFWQYHQMSTNASVFGQRPTNSGLKMSMVGNNFTGKHPYEIMYALHNDTAGSAGGVAYALSQQTNQTAKSALAGDSLYHLNIKYWEKRFNTRDIKLRMHGATGEMFNSAQAAFLSRLSSHKLMALLKGRFGGPSSVDASILNQARAVGLGSKRKMEALLYAQKTKGDSQSDTKNPSFDLSMPEMLAFVSDIAQYAQAQLFESTYESKLDIAHKVCEVTGFEFYQDVDGDFVFKPPMYNLDTKSSRVYRIEDIDIISINFDDKEPQVTYMVCKGSQFSNIKGTGTEGEWGVQGQYIDYRLVAQFGWRPGNFETAYLTDPKSMFFAAVNRLDIMNAPTTSASATIPLRPELRPGYPVYIPYLDSYYYCNSFAHGFSVGGSCTTSLQLIARRSKFYAPGDTSQKGIEAIHLEYPNLPTKPLQVLDNSGRPRLSGFPNVVMALDPTQIDPLFFIVGTDIENVEDDDTLEGLLRMAIKLGVVTPVVDAENTKDPNKLGPYFTMSVDDVTDAKFYFKTGDAKGKGGDGSFNLKQAAAEYVKKTKAANGKLSKGNEAVGVAGGKVAAAEKEVQAKEKAGENTKGAESKLAAATKELNEKTLNAQKAQEAMDKGLAADQTNGMDKFIKLLRGVSEKFSGSKQFSQRYGSNPGSAITLLDMLSDRKAVFTNGSLPGSYRYFSCAHPNPEQQGMKNLTLNLRAGKKETGGKAIHLTDENLDDEWKTTKVPMFVKTPMTAQPNGLLPEAQLVQGTPSRGIRVLNGKYHGGNVPTSEIRELMFAVHVLLATAKKGKRAKFARSDTLGPTLLTKLVESAVRAVGEPPAANTITQSMAKWFSDLTGNITAITASIRKNSTLVPVAEFPSLVAPTTISYNGTIDTNKSIATFQFLDNPPANTVMIAGSYPEIFPNSGTTTKIQSFWLAAAEAYAESVYDMLCKTSVAWWNSMLDQVPMDPEWQGGGLNNMGRDQAKIVAVNGNYSSFVSKLQDRYGVTTKVKEGATSSEPTNAKNFVYTPVFPISDAQGYMVIGAYRYGRDVDIDPAGVFDVLHKQDPLAMLDKTLIDNILTAVIKNEPITVKKLKGTTPGGAPIYGKDMETLTGDTAKNYVEKQALAVWRSRWSDKDILDRGLASMELGAEGKPNVLHVDLNNWIQTVGQSGITKVPVINAAYSLGDLAPHGNREFCSCKAAEADILLDIAGQQNFVQFSQGSMGGQGGKGDTPVDSTIQWVKNVTSAASIPWTQSQVALRGTAKEQTPTSLIKTVTSLGDQFKAVEQDVAAKKAAFDASQENLKQLRAQQEKK